MPPADTSKPTLTYGVNYSVDGIAHGGHLNIYGDRMEFKPTTVDSALSGSGSFSIPTNQIQSVGAAKRTYNLFDGGLRKRLRITTSDGKEFLFVINKLEKAISELNQFLGKTNTP